MKITRDIDLRFRIGDHAIRFEDNIELAITGEEAFQAVFEWDGQNGIIGVINGFSQLMKAAPEEKIAALTPEARRLIAGFLEGAAKRFYEQPAAPALSLTEAAKVARGDNGPPTVPIRFAEKS